MADFYKKSESSMNENDQFQNYSTDKASSKNRKIEKKLLLVLAVCVLSMIAATCVVKNGSTSFSLSNTNPHSEKTAQELTEIMSDNKVDKKELKKLVKHESVRPHLDNNELIDFICDTIEKYGSPSEENLITRDDANEIMSGFLNEKVTYDNWTSSSWPLYYFEEKNLFVFMEYYNRDSEVKHYRIFDKNNDRFCFVRDDGAAFTYTEYSIDILMGMASNNLIRYSSAFIDKSTKRMICGYEWVGAGKHMVHTIYDKDDNAEIYALYCDDKVYYDASMKEATRDDYNSAMDYYDDYIEETYNSNFGLWGI